jgi:hypothetical protein
MLCFILGINEVIINEYHYELVQLIHEYGVHKVHEIGRCICETEGHHQKIIETISGGERHFWNVTWSNLYLMIA